MIVAVDRQSLGEMLVARQHRIACRSSCQDAAYVSQQSSTFEIDCRPSISTAALLQSEQMGILLDPIYVHFISLQMRQVSCRSSNHRAYSHQELHPARLQVYYVYKLRTLTYTHELIVCYSGCIMVVSMFTGLSTATSEQLAETHC